MSRYKCDIHTWSYTRMLNLVQMFVFNNWQQFLTLIVNIDPSVKKENMLPTL